MSVIAGLLSGLAVTVLPPLPATALAQETPTGVQLQTMAGRPLVTPFRAHASRG